MSTPGDDAAESAARGRTMAHMRRMLATATAVASAASCSRSEGGTVVVTIPPASATSSNMTPVPRPPPTAVASDTVAEPPPAPSDTAGYLVVDMLPAPARCMGLANASHATARFRHDASGVVLDVTVTLPAGQATFTKVAPNAWSGVIVSSGYPNALTATVRLRPPPGAAATTGSLGVSFGVNCGSAGNGMLTVTTSFMQPPKDGSTPTLSLRDY